MAAHRLPAAMTDGLYDVVVVGVDGAEQRLAKAGITDIAVLDGVDLSGSVFDEAPTPGHCRVSCTDHHL